MTQFFYGRGQNYLDITEHVYRSCSDGNRIYIPGDDILRGSIFPDPLYGVVKNIAVFGTEHGKRVCRVFDSGTPVILNLTEQEKRKSPVRSGRIAPPPPHLSSIDDRIEYIHRQLEFVGGSLKDEWPEQSMVMSFLDPDSKVLEIGANIGRNTLMISSMLRDSRHLVSMECDPVSVEMLRNNRFANGLRFHIEPSALSYRKLIQRGWETIPSEELRPGYQWVPTVTFEELKSKYRIDFDTLVADCEGALYFILEDNDSVLEGITTVIIESDYLSALHKIAVESIFKSHQLERVYSQPLIADWNHQFPEECVASFFEVWKRSPMEKQLSSP